MSQTESNPNFSSSDEEEDDQSSGPQSSDSPSKLLADPQDPDISSESEESVSDTDSDLDSDSPASKSTVVDPSIKPIRSIPMEPEELGQNSELGQKSGSGSSADPERSNGKRPAEDAPANEKDAKKQLFQRLWSEDDEIVILKGMIDYKAENNENLIGDMGAFHEFIKKSLHADFSRAQLVDKIRRLKKKYVNNVSKEKDGKDRNFSKIHEQKGYELSKLIWGNSCNSEIDGKKNKVCLKNGNLASTSNANGNGNGNGNGNSTGSGGGVSLVKCNGLVDDDEEEEKRMDVSRFVRYGGNDGPVLIEEIVKGGMELVEGEKRVELEKKWRSLKKEELEIYLKKMELIREQGLIVLEAVNSSGN